MISPAVFSTLVLLSTLAGLYYWFTRPSLRVVFSRIGLGVLLALCLLGVRVASVYAGAVAALIAPLVLGLWRGWGYAGLTGFLAVYSFALADLLGLVASVFSAVAGGVVVSVVVVLLYLWGRGGVSRLLASLLLVAAGLVVYAARGAEFLVYGSTGVYEGVALVGAVAGCYLAGGPVGYWLVGLAASIVLGLLAGGFSAIAVVAVSLVYLVTARAEGVWPGIGRGDWWGVLFLPFTVGFGFEGVIGRVLDVSSLALFNFTPALVYLVTGSFLYAGVAIAVSTLLSAVLWAAGLGLWGFGAAGLIVAGFFVARSYGWRILPFAVLAGSVVLGVVGLGVVGHSAGGWHGVVPVGGSISVGGANCTVGDPRLSYSPAGVRVDVWLRGCGVVFGFDVSVLGALGASRALSVVGDCLVFFEALPTPSLEARVLGLVLLGLEFNATGTGVELAYRSICGFTSVALLSLAVAGAGIAVSEPAATAVRRARVWARGLHARLWGRGG